MSVPKNGEQKILFTTVLTKLVRQKIEPNWHALIGSFFGTMTCTLLSIAWLLLVESMKSDIIELLSPKVLFYVNRSIVIKPLL